MISVIIPFHNEAENLRELIPELSHVLSGMGRPFEIILADDGSFDGYKEKLRQELEQDHVRLIMMGRQMGKGKALQKGIEISKGDSIVFMDADLQDDPADLPRLIAALDEGADLVNGNRAHRKDIPLIRIYSKAAAWFLKKYLNSPFTDINCGYKAFKRPLIESIPLYGNNFRFFPLAAFYEGFKVSELIVHNRDRRHGNSKYGIGKLFIGIIDMLSAYFLYKFAESPMHFFGSIGAFFAGIGGLALAYITFERIFMGVLLYKRPLLQYSIFFFILGVQIIMTGILGELIVYLHKRKKL